MKLDDTFLKQVEPAMQEVWQQIAYDAIDASQAMGDRVTNAAAIEMTLDADRLSSFGHEATAKLIDAAIEEHGYVKVERFLRRNVHLPLA